MTKPKITLYVDIISPFTYMAYWLTRNSPTFKSCEITYVPVLIGGIFKATGNSAPLTIKNKDKWINKERLRWASQFNIPMRQQVPKGFPMLPTVTVQRLLCAIESKSPSHLPIALDTFYAAFWAPETLPNFDSENDYDLKDPDTLLKLLSPDSVLGAELAKEMIEAIGSADVKSQLGKNTEKVLADGAFGLPWFTCTNSKGETDGFWGFDHVGQVVRFLGLDGDLRPIL